MGRPPNWLRATPANVTTAPFSEPEVFDFPGGIGPVECVNVEHEEVLLIPRWVDVDRATFKYGLGNEFIEFKARFGGVAREIVVPVDHVVAIYARENGQGMAFPVPTAPESVSQHDTAEPGAAHGAAADRGLRLARSEADDGDKGGAASSRDHDPPEPSPPRPKLKRIK